MYEWLTNFQWMNMIFYLNGLHKIRLLSMALWQEMKKKFPSFIYLKKFCKLRKIQLKFHSTICNDINNRCHNLKFQIWLKIENRIKYWGRSHQKMNQFIYLMSSLKMSLVYSETVPTTCLYKFLISHVTPFSTYAPNIMH